MNEFVEKYKEETLSLLRELASIPAPSHQEEKRGEFCLKWLKEQGADDAYIDGAGNVIFPYHCGEDRKCVVFMAHMDVVFPDTDALPVEETEDLLRAPGVGDDTANLVNLLMCVKYVLEKRLVPADLGILFVANTCEEGLGNLKGSKEIFAHYGDRIQEMISFDLYLDSLINAAVGSHRYQISVKTQGGHSYSDFGRKSAIQVLAEMIHDLYRVHVPEEGKTTYNVGRIEGGTSVNTIAESASMYYEFRSDRQSALEFMEKEMRKIIDAHRSCEAEIRVELLGVRPCGSEELPKDRMDELAERQAAIMERFARKPIETVAASTDANVPLSMGIPAVTLGTVLGGGAHTYEEWIEKDSMITGQKIALASVLYYFNP